MNSPVCSITPSGSPPSTRREMRVRRRVSSRKNAAAEPNRVIAVAAMASNFLLNNEITYRTHRYRGFAMLGGFLAFALACGVGAFANIDVASMLYRSNRTWWLSGLSGALLSVVWNYAVSSRLIWRPRSRR